MLNDLNVGYLSIAEADWDNSPDLPDSFRAALRAAFRAPIMYAGRYTREKAERVLSKCWGDLFGIGRPFLANPDLPARLEKNVALNPVDSASLIGGTAKGYTDYPYYSFNS